MTYHRSALRSSSALGALALGMAALALPSSVALAQSATPLPPVAVETTGDMTTPSKDSSLDGTNLLGKRNGGDTSSLLRSVPGVSVNAAGGVSSLPSIHGLADDRILSLVDGVQVNAACPNHMNPPFSYIEPAHIDKIEVFSGIAPVSRGGDSIGGTISVESPAPVFAGPNEGLHTEGRLSSYFKSNASNVGASGSGTIATRDLSLTTTGGWNRAADYRAGGGDSVSSTSYENMDYSVTAAARHDGQSLQLKAGQQFIPYENFPNQPMDMVGNHQTFAHARYQGEFDWGSVDATGFWNHVFHKMDDITTDKHNNMMPMPMFTQSSDTGYTVKAEIPVTRLDTLRIGNELHLQTLNDWWPATTSTTGMMGPNTFVDIDNGRRDRFGTFAEWEKSWSPAWSTLAGVRSDIVWSDADRVQGYNNGTMMAMSNVYVANANAFNSAPHSVTDYNFDGTLLARYEADKNTSFEGGLARKTRSPSLYERYTWNSATGMTASMIGWFGDGNGYVGNPDLRPEAAHTVSASAELHDQARKEWDVKLTPYFTYVRDYINVDLVGRDTYPSGNGQGNILRFANHDAELYGADLSGHANLAKTDEYGAFGFGGVAGWVRGFQINNGASLYHMMPLNTKLSLDHKLGGWSSAVELQLVADKSEADPLRKEPFTPGYGLVNLRTAYDWRDVRFDLGIDNVFDHSYALPEGGADLGDWWNHGPSNRPYGAVPGMGRSYNAGVTVKF